MSPLHEKLDQVEWGEWRLGDLFEKLSTRYIWKWNKFENVSNIKNQIYSIPLTYAKSWDNWIMYWWKKWDFETHKNVISIIYNWAIAAGLVYAQENETWVLAESYLIKLKNFDVSFKINLFLKNILEKVLYTKYSREYLATWANKVENDTISLPIKNGEIDFAFMENFVAEIEAERMWNWMRIWKRRDWRIVSWRRKKKEFWRSLRVGRWDGENGRLGNCLRYIPTNKDLMQIKLKLKKVDILISLELLWIMVCVDILKRMKNFWMNEIQFLLDKIRQQCSIKKNHILQVIK